MKMTQISDSCYAVLNEKNLVCDANSGLINRGGGVVVDTQSDLPHARRMIELFGTVWKHMPTRHQHPRRRRPRLGKPAL
jgi:cyclase